MYDASMRVTRSLALVSIWYAEPTMRHEPMPLARARSTALVSLESWSTTSTSGTRKAVVAAHRARTVASYAGTGEVPADLCVGVARR
jgi:hypothetical protein